MDTQNTKQETELTPKEIKQIKRYCIFPKLVLPAVFGALMMPFVMIVLTMINEIGLNAQADHTIELLFIMMGICIVWIFIYAYGLLGPRSGMKKKKWKQILNKITAAQQSVTGDEAIVSGVGLTNVGHFLQGSDSSTVSAFGTAAQIAGTIGTMAAVGKQMNQVQGNAMAVADMARIKIPSLRKYRLALLLLPSLLMTILFFPIFRESVLDNRQMNETIAIRMEQLEKTMQDDFTVTQKDDPFHRDFDDCSIEFTAKDDSENQILRVTFEEKGTITELRWSMDEDSALSREENIRHMTELINASADKILSADIPLWIDPPENFFSIPEPVITEFLQTPENEETSGSVTQDHTWYFLNLRMHNSSSALPNELHYTIESRVYR